MFCCLVKDPAGRHIAPVDQHQVNTVKDDDKSESLQRNKPSDKKALAIAGRRVNAKTHTQMFCDQQKKEKEIDPYPTSAMLAMYICCKRKWKTTRSRTRLEK